MPDQKVDEDQGAVRFPFALPDRIEDLGSRKEAEVLRFAVVGLRHDGTVVRESEVVDVLRFRLPCRAREDPKIEAGPRSTEARRCPAKENRAKREDGSTSGVREEGRAKSLESAIMFLLCDSSDRRSDREPNDRWTEDGKTRPTWTQPPLATVT